MLNFRILFIFPLFLPLLSLSQQAIDHWETAVFDNDLWRYRYGVLAPVEAWIEPGFDDSSWSEGPGGIGYGDGDDNTTIQPTVSVFMRQVFEVGDPSKVEMAVLHADYDDGFVAYLNGVEIARANIGQVGIIPPFNQFTDTDHEAQMYQGGNPDAFSVPKSLLEPLLEEGTNTLAIQVHNASSSSSDLTARFFLSFAINDETTWFEPTPGWFFLPFTSSNLPLLFIDTYGQAIPDEPRIEAHLGIVDNGEGERNYLGDPLNGYDGQIAIEIRGASSQMFPKKNYSFETQDAEGNNNNVALLGMPEENDWVLHGPYTDKSLLRNVLAYHIGWQTGRYTPRTRWCELFINGQYRGLYVLTERIKRDNNRVDIANLTPEDIAGDELTGGYIVSIDRDDPGIDDGWYSPYTNNTFYKYQHPDHDQLLPVQKNYIRNVFMEFEHAMANEPAAQIYEQYIDVSSWVDYRIATEVFKHIDGYKLSFYMYKRKDSNGGKIHFGPLWDLNLAFGNFDFGEDPNPQGWSYLWAGAGFLYPFWVIPISTIPNVQNLTRCRWDELRVAGLQTGALLQFIEEQEDLIEEARIRNFERWPVIGQYVWPNYYVGPTYQSEINYLKNWLINRLSWMDANLPGDCSAVSTEEPGRSDAQVSAFPNPFQGDVIFHFSNHAEKNAQILLYDALGKECGRWDIAAGQPLTLSLEGLENGFYFYQIAVKGQVVSSGKLVKAAG